MAYVKKESFSRYNIGDHAVTKRKVESMTGI